MPGPFSKRDKFSTPEIDEAKKIRDAAQTEHKIAKLREKAAKKRNNSAHQREKAAMYRKKAAKARELSLILKEEAEQLEAQAKELERTLKPIYPDRETLIEKEGATREGMIAPVDIKEGVAVPQEVIEEMTITNIDCIFPLAIITIYQRICPILYF
jgi:hypothetical protein